MLGNLIGRQGQATALLAGGGSGALGGALPDGNPPLSPATDAANTLLGAAAGTSPSPVRGILAGSLIDNAGGVAGKLPLAGPVLQNVVDTAAKLPVTGKLGVGANGGSGNAGLGTVLDTVTNLAGTVPVAGGAGNGSAGPKLGDVLGTATTIAGKTPIIGGIVNGIAGGAQSGGLLRGLSR
jgi:hypothetical protein